MTNSEVFEQYNTEKWVIEQNLCFLLQEYWEKYGKKAVEQAKNGYVTSGMPCNSVSFVKEFMKEETICDVEYKAYELGKAEMQPCWYEPAALC